MSKTVTNRGGQMDRIERLEAALTIKWAQVDSVHVDAVRRLTGPGLIWDRPGAVMDLFFEVADRDAVAVAWAEHARRVLDALGWQDEAVICRNFQGGANLAISAPMDQLYSATFAAKAAWHHAAAELSKTNPLPFERMIQQIKDVLAQEENPALIALFHEAQSRGVDILCDDDEVSIGHGTASQTWPEAELPAPDAVNWPALYDVPLALITGTNGKTTTTRLCAAIGRAAGKTVGLTTTDVVQVGEDVLDRGDYSGPGGARMVLRDERVQIAFLEVARGGILRRGLATRHAQVAAVTNIARDHLGEYGVMTLADLAQAKFTVARGLKPGGILVLNADDAAVVHAADGIAQTIAWFSLDPAAPQITQARALGQPCAYANEGALTFFDGTAEAWSIPVADIPITLSGAARHNVQNALAAGAICLALGLPQAAVREGLSQFVSSPSDNPGRFNEFRHNGARIFIDFAHNPHSIAAVCDALAEIPSRRRLLMLSQPGDRSDQDIADAARTALRFRPDTIIVAEIADYLRGRALSETPDLIAATAIATGIDPNDIVYANTPSDGVLVALEQMQPGDLALLLVLSDRDRVFDMLASS